MCPIVLKLFEHLKGLLIFLLGKPEGHLLELMKNWLGQIISGIGPPFKSMEIAGEVAMWNGIFQDIMKMKNWKIKGKVKKLKIGSEFYKF